MTEALLHSTKYDGSIHYRFATRLIHRCDRVVVLYRAPGVMMHSYRGDWASSKHLLAIFWRDGRYHNADLMWEADWTAKQHYVNIATPAMWDAHARRIHYADLDLDLIRKAGSDAVRLDDEDEFQENQRKWAYPQPLIDRCWAEVDRVRSLMQQRAWPFNDELFAWRPGEPFTPPA